MSKRWGAKEYIVLGLTLWMLGFACYVVWNETSVIR